MSSTFHPENGVLTIAPRLVLSPNMTPHELEQAGVTFVRKIDMKTGWVFRTTGPYDLSGHVIHLSLGFDDERLKEVSFSFANGPGDDTDTVRREHDNFLLKELGKPFASNDTQTVYRYPWGGIASDSDPRGGLPQILIRWD